MNSWQENDDELLVEMGNNFNVLEYADPELDMLTGGKINILDTLNLVEYELIKNGNKFTSPGILIACTHLMTTTSHNDNVIKTEPFTQISLICSTTNGNQHKPFFPSIFSTSSCLTAIIPIRTLEQQTSVAISKELPFVERYCPRIN